MKIKKFKKISAAFLAVVMVVSIFAAMPFTSFASAYTENQLKELLSEYELKINGGKVYTNLSNSYDAYYDAYVSYIGVKSGILSESEIDSAYNSLQSAMSNMFEFTPYAASNPKPSFNADSDSAADVSSTYANLLYTGLNGSKSAGNTVSRWQFEVGYNNTVMLYDGITQPKTQVMYAGRVTAQFLNSETRAPYSAYPTKGSDNYEDNGDLYLPSVWSGGESTNYDYTWSYSHSSYSFGNNASTSSAGKSLSGGTSASAFASYVNSVAFNENTVWSDDEYSKAYEGLNWASISGDTSAADKATAPADKSIYVINYKKLIDALNLSGLDVLNNSYSSVKTLFGALEAAQKVDPNSYFSSASDETISSNVADCAAAIKNAVDNINSAKNSLVAVNIKSYVALAEHYKTYSSAAQGNNSNGYYTDESYADFISAFDSANPVLTDIIYKNIRMSDASQTDTNLVNGYNGLKAAEKYVDDSELQGCFEKYYSLTQSYYTEETYNALTQQISAALNLYNGNDYTLGITLEDTAENEEIYNSVLN
ncbi:MAG: hypothetical protein LUG21_07375, partial [Clostridiales bacterium]|nr:hypothetical protein [Clostridiales bacterium]